MMTSFIKRILLGSLLGFLCGQTLAVEPIYDPGKQQTTSQATNKIGTQQAEPVYNPEKAAVDQKKVLEDKLVIMKELELITQALKKGQSVIIFPGVSGLQEWRSLDDPNDSFEVGFAASGYLSNQHRRRLNFVIVEPGTYYLSEFYDDFTFRNSPHQQYANNPKTKPKLGWITFNNTQFVNYKTEMQWVEEQSHIESTRYSQCVSVYTYSGMCASTANFTQSKKVVDRPAGYKPKTNLNEKDGVSLDVTFEPKQSPVTVEVDIGEVVVTDSLWFLTDKGSFKWSNDQCSSINSQQNKCSLNEIRYYVGIGSQEMLQEGAFKRLTELGWTEKQLQLIKYRPLKTKGNKIGKDGYLIK